MILNLKAANKSTANFLANVIKKIIHSTLTETICNVGKRETVKERTISKITPININNAKIKDSQLI
jgi:hypothetical protein